MTNRQKAPSRDVRSFVPRHIGPSESETREMLAAIGVKSLDALIDATVPESIRLRRPCHRGPDGTVQCTCLHRGDRRTPMHLAHVGATDDGDDASGKGPDGTRRFVFRGAHPNGLGTSEPKPHRCGAPIFSQSVDLERIRNDGSRPCGLRSASSRSAVAGIVGRISASRRSIAPGRWCRRGT